MSEWTSKALSDVVELQRGHDLPSSQRRAGTVPIVGSFGITGFHDEARYAGPGVTIGRSGASIGSATYVATPYWPLNTSLFVRDFKGNHPYWVFRLLGSIDFHAFNSGSAQPSLNRNFLRSIPVSVPPLLEQQAIAEVLGALDDKIAANTRLAAKSDEVLSTLFESMVDEKTEFVGLSSIADVNAESIKPTGRGDLRYVDIASVGVGRFAFPEISAWADAPGRARRRLRRGDTIWSTVRPNRRSHALNLSDDPLLVASTGLAVLTPRFVSPSYLYEVTHRPDFTVYLENVAEGSAYPAVRADRFNDAPVPLLGEEARHRFDDFAEPLRKAIATAEVENRTLAAIRDALLPQLMSGRLRVNDVKAFEEEAGL
jgi:type I restriction enzyme S subunit